MDKNSKVRVSIAGASGYAGGELLRYLTHHPQAEVATLLAHSQVGAQAAELFPNLHGVVHKSLESPDWQKLGKENDVVFLCLPHGQSQEPVKELLSAGCRVVDLGADFRLHDPALYHSTYGAEHKAPELLRDAIYGLPEKNKLLIKETQLVANPGCYPTASLLALLPLLAQGKLGAPVIIDAKSGVSGAGRGLKAGSLYCEVNENFKAYGIGTHRHQPEIEQTVGQDVLFTPHLVPMSRGILATVYVAVDFEGLPELYQDYYKNQPFVDFPGVVQTKSVSGTNFCHLSVHSSGRDGYSIICSAIDNLGKGAAGTAVHNMNLMFGFKETCGLESRANWP